MKNKEHLHISERKNMVRRFWEFLREDTWQSWIVSMVLLVIFIKFIFFPILSFLTGTSLPLVVVESCSMYHETDFDEWWLRNGVWYEERNITKNEFKKYTLDNGLNKGDIVFVIGSRGHKKGDIIIFNGGAQYPIIHRIISENPISTKGDHNPGQLPVEKIVSQDIVIGKAVGRIPYIGWIKLIFFEFRKPQEQRGFCK